MKCPHCPDVTLVMTDRQGLEIDYCPSCRGIWLDRGELDKLLDRASSMQPAPASQQRPAAVRQPDFADSDFGQQRPYKRKKSWLNEIFD